MENLKAVRLKKGVCIPDKEPGTSSAGIRSNVPTHHKPNKEENTKYIYQE